MEPIYRVFEASGNVVEAGAKVERFRLSNGAEIPAVVVGEHGRGRVLGVLPVAGIGDRPECRRAGSTKLEEGESLPSWIQTGVALRCRECGATVEKVPSLYGGHLLAHSERKEMPRLHAASIATTRSGRPKLVAAEKATESTAAIVVLRSPIGFRGSNRHWIEDGNVERSVPSRIRVLASGFVAQGAAGRMGGGEQLVVQLPASVVLGLEITGRRYGAPSRFFYRFDGERLEVLTAEEREVGDLW